MHTRVESRQVFYVTPERTLKTYAQALEPGDWVERIRMLRPNASAMDKIALCKIGHLEEGDPQGLGMLLGQLGHRYPHIDIWGGCCGTWEKHLGQIAQQVKHESFARTRRDCVTRP